MITADVTGSDLGNRVRVVGSAAEGSIIAIPLVCQRQRAYGLNTEGDGIIYHGAAILRFLENDWHPMNVARLQDITRIPVVAYCHKGAAAKGRGSGISSQIRFRERYLNRREAVGGSDHALTGIIDERNKVPRRRRQ